MHVALLSIGDEIITGDGDDTNAPWLAQRIGAIGGVVVERRTVPDDRAAIAGALRDLAALGEVVIATGGLGPTDDDLTRDALLDVVDPGAAMVVDEAARASLDRWFRGRGRSMPARNLAQAQRPRPARCLANPNGTAPGLAAVHDGCRIYLLPGPPREMRPMYDALVEPDLPRDPGGPVTAAADVSAFGLGESHAVDRLGDLTARNRRPMVGTTAGSGIVTARIRDVGPAAPAQAAVQRVRAAIEAAWAPYAFTADGATLPEALGARLAGAGLVLTVAESCTGGWAAKSIVDVAGSSAWFNGGFVTYADAMKSRWLGVGADLLAAHGAVSAPVARAMATGALGAADADIAVSITGVAGPGGGTPGKPVGTVWIAIARRGAEADAAVRHFRFRGDRETVRDRSVKAALQLLRLEIMGRSDVRLLGEVRAEAAPP